MLIANVELIEENQTRKYVGWHRQGMREWFSHNRNRKSSITFEPKLSTYRKRVTKILTIVRHTPTSRRLIPSYTDKGLACAGKWHETLWMKMSAVIFTCFQSRRKFGKFSPQVREGLGPCSDAGPFHRVITVSCACGLITQGFVVGLFIEPFWQQRRAFRTKISNTYFFLQVR